VATADGAEGFSEEFFENLAAIDERHFWFRGRNALVAWALRRYFPAARSFLDVGCGTGQMTRALQQAFPALRLTAVEAFDQGLAMTAQRVPSAELVRANVRRLPWEDEFDVAGAFDVLEHVREDESAIAELTRVVRPGGGVIVTVPQHQWLWSPVDDHSGHFRRYSRARLLEPMLAAGLEIVRVTSFVSLLLPVLALLRVASRGKPYRAGTETRISPLVNAIGAGASRLEGAAIAAGVSLPLGGSLLVIARRA
jgi:SAM-dependent methyltransferase